MNAPPNKNNAPETGPGYERSELPGDEGEASWEATVRKDILVGQRIGEYVVRRRIGSGGMGVVYEGEHPVIGRKVAIKILRPDEDGLRARDLAAEARATSAIRHRGIIDIFGFGTLPGIGQYLVMELLSGRPLDEVLQRREPLPLVEALRLTGEILGALSAAHSVGIIHRDLKPGNIFLVRETQGAEYVKVLDFGLAKQAAAPHGTTPQTRASVVLGTPEYMAPEQAYGQAVSPRTDLYAVGIILFEMLTGRMPFVADTPMHLLIKQIHEAPPSPASFVDGLPPELDALVLRLLAKEPEQRPASAEDTAHELNEILRALQWDTTRISGVTPSVARPSSRGPSVAPPSREGPRSGVQDAMAVSPTVISKPVPVAAAPTLRVEAPPEAPRSTHAHRKAWLGAGALLLVLVGGGLAVGSRTTATPPPPPPPVLVAQPTEPAPVPAAPASPPEPAPAIATAPAVTPPTVTPPPATDAAGAAAQPERRQAMGFLQVVALGCRGNLYIDGKPHGDTPQPAFALRAGKHSVALKGNPRVHDELAWIVIREGKLTEFNARCQRVE